MDPRMDEEQRSLIESVLEASRDRLRRLAAALDQTEAQPVEALGEDPEEPIHEWSERELTEAARAAGEGSEEAAQMAARAIDRMGRELKLGARPAIEACLSNPSSLLRAASMKVLALHWRLRDYTDRVLWSLSSDNEPDCRRAAALCLGSLYEGTMDRRIGQELVATLMKSDEPEDVRWASYYALLDLDGGRRLPRPLPIADFDPPRDADPALLARYSDMDAE